MPLRRRRAFHWPHQDQVDVARVVDGGVDGLGHGHMADVAGFVHLDQDGGDAGIFVGGHGVPSHSHARKRRKKAL